MTLAQETDETPEDVQKYPDRIGQLFTGKTVLISGGTGFMGKVLVEKLLRSCGGIHKMYLLVRTKKGKDPNERIREIFNGPLFDLLKKVKGDDIIDKVEAIPADMSAPDLAISSENRKKLNDEVEIIFHCAATIRFDERLKKAVLLNVRGTKLMLELGKQCKKLIVFTHISTAYCHLNERVLYEKAYDPPADPHQVIKACEWLSDDVIDDIQDKILGDFPNSYAYTKSLAESLVNEEMSNIPALIIRPSVVVPIWKEPIPGWTDNINGPMGLLIGAGKGVIRSMFCNSDTYSDYVPVDIVINAAICCTYCFTVNSKQKYYHITSSSEHKISFEQIIDLGRTVVSTRMPFNGVLWYPGGNIKKSRLLHQIDFFLYQWLPAIFIDVLLVILGYPPVLKRVQRRILKGYDVFEYYANRQWDFNNECGFSMRDTYLNPKERQIFKVDGEGINYLDYFTDCTHAARLYILNETDDQIPSAKRHMTIMYYVDKISKTLVVLGFFYLLWRYFLSPIFGVQ